MATCRRSAASTRRSKASSTSAPPRGLTGTQGVLIPHANVQHLMLREDVVDACAAGRFAVYPVATIDEGIALLTGLPAGERGADGPIRPAASIGASRTGCGPSPASAEISPARATAAEHPPISHAEGNPTASSGSCCGLQPGAHDRTMQLAVELADLLHLDLLGLFLEDSSLRDLAGIPFSREFRPLGGGWHAIDLSRLSHDFELAARNIERKFMDAAKRLSTGCQFEIARGPMAETFASVSRSDDIVMIVEPRSPAERATQQFAWLLEGAFRSAAAVMLVPPHIARTKGPVVAIATSSDDPSILAAAAIAFAAKEELVIIETDGLDADDPQHPQACR